MPITGQHRLTIDAKNRLLIPFAVREQIGKDDGQQFYVTVGKRPRTLELYPRGRLDRYWEKRPPLPGATREIRDMRLFELASTQVLEQDSQGRVLIPEEMLQDAELEREVYLVGAGDHLQVWRRDDFKAFKAEQRARYAELVEKAREYSITPDAVGAATSDVMVSTSG